MYKKAISDLKQGTGGYEALKKAIEAMEKMEKYDEHIRKIAFELTIIPCTDCPVKCDYAGSIKACEDRWYEWLKGLENEH